MYSYEDRIRAVRRYIKLGKRTGATILQLGYPTKNALKTWHREFEKCCDLPTSYSRSKSKYSDEQKKAVVEHYLNLDRCIASVIKEFGYPGRKALGDWIDELNPEARERVVGKAVGLLHSSDFKRAAIIDLCKRQESAQAVAQKLDVDRTTLYKWKNQQLGHEVPASMKRHKDSLPEADCTELEQQIESLRRDIHQLQLEHDLLKKANEIVKKDLGIGPCLLTNREKTMLVDALKETYTVPELLTELVLARSSYFYHRARFQGADKYVELRSTITEIFELNHRCYRYRRIRASLGKQNVVLSETVVQRLMKQERLVVPRPKRRRYSSYLGEICPAPENIINRDF